MKKVEKDALTIMCGLPLSGKSTYCAERKKEGYVIISPDEIRLAMYGSPFIYTAEPFVWATAQTMARSLLNQGYKVIIDATNITEESRRKWRNIASDFDIYINIVFMQTPAYECYLRNEEIKRLDHSIILDMALRFEPPKEYEGKIIEYFNSNQGQGGMKMEKYGVDMSELPITDDQIRRMKELGMTHFPKNRKEADEKIEEFINKEGTE